MGMGQESGGRKRIRLDCVRSDPDSIEAIERANRFRAPRTTGKPSCPLGTISRPELVDVRGRSLTYGVRGSGVRKKGAKSQT
jgi:hypothetical protein